ncbi:hypothetical protein HYDPIDRAFT_110966 [Hydnomerulius pinastri MD-312]|uniref:Uncharacterized protein n=1 Tax=Hydnomerulius pinastri MD-312 TaxID=994086 RepID=A0A0C9W278_9AGAM|nr:hypothetical protein HYDPIDRAFT_110966 [Hydnomerulius pinastri MD-312]
MLALYGIFLSLFHVLLGLAVPPPRITEPPVTQRPQKAQRQQPKHTGKGLTIHPLGLPVAPLGGQPEAMHVTGAPIFGTLPLSPGDSIVRDVVGTSTTPHTASAADHIHVEFTPEALKRSEDLKESHTIHRPPRRTTSPASSKSSNSSYKGSLFHRSSTGSLERFCKGRVARSVCPEIDFGSASRRPSCPKRHSSLHTTDPPPRTDPYNAPYYFPAPGTPEAVDYVRKIREEQLRSPVKTSFTFKFSKGHKRNSGEGK